VNWIHVAHDRNQLLPSVNTAMKASGSTIEKVCLEEVNHCHISKKNSGSLG
jgi:hypothetical protein